MYILSAYQKIEILFLVSILHPLCIQKLFEESLIKVLFVFAYDSMNFHETIKLN